MRWPFGPPHMTLKPSKRNTKKQQNKKKQKKDKKREKKQEKTKNTQKWAFQLSVKIFLFFGWVSKISLFWQLGPKSAHPKNTIKIGVSANFFLENTYASRNGHFWTKKTQIHKFQIIFFCLFSSLSTTENTKNCWNTYFYSVLANQKKRIFKFYT